MPRPAAAARRRSARPRRRRRGPRRSRAPRRAGRCAGGSSRPGADERRRASGSCSHTQRHHLVEQEPQAVAVGLVGEVRDEHRARLARPASTRARSPRRRRRSARSAGARPGTARAAAAMSASLTIHDSAARASSPRSKRRSARSDPRPRASARGGSRTRGCGRCRSTGRRRARPRERRRGDRPVGDHAPAPGRRRQPRGRGRELGGDAAREARGTCRAGARGRRRRARRAPREGTTSRSSIPGIDAERRVGLVALEARVQQRQAAAAAASARAIPYVRIVCPERSTGVWVVTSRSLTGAGARLPGGEGVDRAAISRRRASHECDGGGGGALARAAPGCPRPARARAAACEAGGVGRRSRPARRPRARAAASRPPAGRPPGTRRPSSGRCCR